MGNKYNNCFAFCFYFWAFTFGFSFSIFAVGNQATSIFLF